MLIGTRVQRIWFLLLVFTFLLVPNRGSAQKEKENDKPLLVVVYADWCPYCQKLKPVLALLHERYKNRIHFVHLDVTSQATTAASRQEAGRFGLSSFLDQYQYQTSLVVIQNSARHEIFRAVHDYDFGHYAAVLDEQLKAQK